MIDSTLVASCSPVLLVDADDAAAQRLADQLREYGFRVEVATSGWAARRALRWRYYGCSVIATDLSLATDLDCVRQLRHQSHRTWIIVLSSTPAPDALEIAHGLGADALMVKPFSMEELISRLQALLGRPRPS